MSFELFPDPLVQEDCVVSTFFVLSLDDVLVKTDFVVVSVFVSTHSSFCEDGLRYHQSL